MNAKRESRVRAATTIRVGGAMLVVASLVTSCRQSPELSFATKSSTNSVECAKKRAASQGWAESTGYSRKGYTTLHMPIFMRGGPVASDSTIADYLMFQATNDSLHILTVGMTLKGKLTRPAPKSAAYARAIISECGASANPL